MFSAEIQDRLGSESPFFCQGNLFLPVVFKLQGTGNKSQSLKASQKLRSAGGAHVKRGIEILDAGRTVEVKYAETVELVSP